MKDDFASSHQFIPITGEIPRKRKDAPHERGTSAFRQTAELVERRLFNPQRRANLREINVLELAVHEM